MDKNANTITTMGIISDEVYDGKNIYFTNEAIQDGRLIQGTTYKVIDHTDTSTDMQALLLEKTDSDGNSLGEYVVAFRGTGGTVDVLVDYIIGLGNINAQYSDAVAFVNDMKTKHGIDNNSLTLTGHSLGGILTQQVGAALKIDGYAYNPYGVDRLLSALPSSDLLSAMINTAIYKIMDSVGLDSSAESWAKEHILNISYNDFGLLNGDVLSNVVTELTSSHLGSYMPIIGSDVGVGDGHSIKTLNSAIEHYNEVLSHFSSDTTYAELSAIYLSVEDYEKTEAVFNDLGIYQATDLSLTLLTDKQIPDLASKTPATIYALENLNPFVITGDLSAYDEIDLDNYSNAQIRDLAAMGYYSMHEGSKTGGVGTVYINKDGEKVFDKKAAINQIVFGSNKGETLNSLTGDDRLYGNGGNDTIKASSGNDYLEGGLGSDRLEGGSDADILIGGTADKFEDKASDTLEGGEGFDTYIVGAGDVIKDTDGKGLVYFREIDLSGVKRKDDSGRYKDSDFSYEESNGTLTVKHLVTGESITIKDWEEADLGISLNSNLVVTISDASAVERAEGMNFYISLSRNLLDGEELTLRVMEVQYTLTHLGWKSSADTTNEWKSGNPFYTYTWRDNKTPQSDRTFTVSGSVSFKGEGEVTVKEGIGTIIDDDVKEERYDPLALDMDRDGFISTLSLKESIAYFDITGDGLREHVGWIASNDALLAYDKNENGQIDGIGEVFGNLNENGFEEAKRLIDSNYDNKIDRKDTLFNRLEIWNDLDEDGRVDEGELTTLSEAEITSLDLNYVSTEIETNGNLLSEASRYTTKEGERELAADLQLAADLEEWKKVNTADNPQIVENHRIVLDPKNSTDNHEIIKNSQAA